MGHACFELIGLIVIRDQDRFNMPEDQLFDYNLKVIKDLVTIDEAFL